MTLEQIRNAFRQGRYKITNHATQQMSAREVYEEDLEYAFEHGAIVREVPNARPYPKVHVAAILPNGVTLIVVVSKPKRSQIYRIVTVFFPHENGEFLDENDEKENSGQEKE
jgi:hypothetical protein